MTTVQYGKKDASRAPVNNNENQWDPFASAPYQYAVPNVEPAPVEIKETTAPKKPRKEFGAQAQQTSAAFSVFDRAQKTIYKPEKKKKTSNTDITSGHPDDIAYLVREIEKRKLGISVHSIHKLIIPPPYDFGTPERERCTAWLTKIGFEQTAFLTFNLALENVHEIERALKTVYKPIPQSTSSEFFVAESTSSRTDDSDRSERASAKLRQRSESNPPPLLTSSNLAEMTPSGPSGPSSFPTRPRSNSTFSSGLAINTGNSGRARKGTVDSYDSSDYTESPSCFPDNFSPMSRSTRGGRPDSSCGRRAPSPWQSEIGDLKISVEDEEGLGGSSSGGLGGASNGGAYSSRSAKLALHCIHEEDHPNDMTMEEEGIRVDLPEQQQQQEEEEVVPDFYAAPVAAEEEEDAGHDSDESTVLDEDEGLPDHEDDIVSPEVTTSDTSGLHANSASMDHSPPHIHNVLMMNDSHNRSCSFSSPSSGGRADPVPIASLLSGASHASPPAAGGEMRVSHGVTFHQGHLPNVTRSTSLFGDASSQANYHAAGPHSALNPSSPDMLAFRTQRPMGGAGGGAGAANRNARNNRMDRLNPPARTALVRSHTEPINIANMVVRGDSTPAPRGLAQPADNHFNTPQAVAPQTEWEWEWSQGADERLMRLLLEKLERDERERPEDQEQAQRNREMTCLSNATLGCDLFSNRRGDGVTPGGSFVDALSHMSPNNSDDSRIESLASSTRPRDSLGSYENVPGRPPLSALSQTARSWARTLTRGRSMVNFNGSSSSSSSGDNVLIDTHSPLHPTQGLTGALDNMAFAAEGASTVTDRMRRNKLRKARTMHRRMSIAFKSVQNANSNNNKSMSMDTSDILNTSRELLFSPGVKAKSSTSTRSRRKSMMNLSMSRIEPMGGVTESQSSSQNSNEDVAEGFVVVSTRPAGPDDLDESKFKGVVIGAHYQHCFDEGVPLVSAAGSEDNRVVDLSLTTAGNLTLQVYLPEKKTCHSVDLGTFWQCIRAAPTGYLVFKNDDEDAGMSQDSWAIGDVIHEPIRLYYFLNKEPAEWMKSPLNKTARSGVATRTSSASGPAFGMQESSHFFRRSEEPSASSSLLSSAIFNSHQMSQGAADGGIASMRSNELRRGTSLQQDFNFNSRDSLTASDDGSMDVSNFNQLDHPDTTVVFDPDNLPESTEVVIRNSVSSSVWGNAWLMSGILSYLTDKKASSSPRSPRGSSRGVSDASRRRYAAALRTVCKTWALAGYMSIARGLSDIDNVTSALVYEKWSAFVKKYNWGKFLSQGACKNVYAVANPAVGGRLEAVSVMDIDDMRDREMTLAVTQELEISMLCSTLTQLNICPNLVQVHSMFQSKFAAPESVWNGREVRSQVVAAPAKKTMQPGSYQYIRMEFCSGGDVEERVRKVKLLPLDTVRSHLFQMCFALYSCREQISLRHFDIKLLNFFSTSGASVLARPEAYSRSFVDVHYGFGKNLYRLSLSASEPQLIKLADFGTSCVGKQSLGDPITLQQFTTLENTPVEYFLLGSLARQCFAADTFSLGLCVLHLLTGNEPYEELLRDVRCPKYLLTRLQKIWMAPDESSPYYLLRECNESIQAAEAETEAEEGSQMSEGNTTDDNDTVAGSSSGLNVLYDTLYRYLVLFGAMDCGATYADNTVWTVLLESLELSPGKRRANKSRSECVAQFHKDAGMWSIESGAHPIMLKARERMNKLPGVGEMLRSMTHFDPSKRCSMYEALHSPLFECFRVQHLTASMLSSPGGGASFMHYFRGGTARDGSRVSNSDVVLDNLPIL